MKRSRREGYEVFRQKEIGGNETGLAIGQGGDKTVLLIIYVIFRNNQ